MTLLILGIILFLGAHTVPMLRETRAGLVAKLGEGGFKGAYSLVAVTGFVLIVYGFHTYRQDGWVQIWVPPAWTRHITVLLMWFAFIALAAMGPKPSRIKGWLRHPMLVAVKIWALAHLLANGDLGGMILFGSFLAWAVVDRISVKRRGLVGADRQPGFTCSDAIIVIAGTVAYVVMMFAHPWVIGVAVIG
jgi:uncharacterized membrane protein